MKKSDVVRLAEAASYARMAADNLSLMNVPLDAEKRVEAAANYRITMDRAEIADKSYRDAFDKWAAAGYPE